jgi:phospholipid/cholesterol/gamma-HCH transport system substrate-binding protein
MVRGLRGTAVKFGVLCVVSTLLFVGLFRLMGNSTGGETREWTARFTSVSGLRAGDDVRAAGVKVGRVDAVEVVGNTEARVRFTLAAGQRVYEGTRLTLRYQNLLGQRYLALTAGQPRGQVVRPGTELSTAMTDPGFDLTALLNGFEPLFSVIEPAEVNELASTMVAVLQGESGTVESLLQQTAEATTYLASKDEVFGQVLANLVPVLDNLDEQSDALDGTVVQLRELMSGLAAERRTFASSIDNLGGLVDSTSSLLRETRPGWRRDLQALRRTARILAGAEQRLAEVLQTLPLAGGAFARTMSYGARLNVYLCNLGIEAAGQRVWVNGDGGPYSEACR